MKNNNNYSIVPCRKMAVLAAASTVACDYADTVLWEEDFCLFRSLSIRDIGRSSIDKKTL